MTNETLRNQDRPAPLYLSDYEVELLSNILGFPKDQLIRSESEFLAETECPPKSLENWLMTVWVQHDIRAVLAGTEKVGRQPWLLLNEKDRTVRLFTPSDATLLADARLEIRLSAEFEEPGQPPQSPPDVLAWWEHLEQTRKSLMDACRTWRAHEWGADREPVLQCIVEIERRIPDLNSRCLLHVQQQSNAIQKCCLLSCDLAAYCGDVDDVQKFADLIAHDKRKWAALIEALRDSPWLASESPLAYLNRTTQTIYRKVRPDTTGPDSQGIWHRAGRGGVTKQSDALHGLNSPLRAAGVKKTDPPPTPEELAYDYTPPEPTDRCLSLEEIAEKPSEAILERRFTQRSVRELEEAAYEDPPLADYIKALASRPKWRRADIWRELGWDQQYGKAVDRKYRRLLKRLREQGAGMEWREVPVPGSSNASQFIYFDVLSDGAKGARFGLYQHKSLKTHSE